MEGINPIKESAHQKILRAVGKNKRVLEVGAGRGFVSEKMRENGCSVTAIEIDSRMAEEAKKRCSNVLVGNVESMQLGFKPESFDVLLFADVLEHLRFPDMVLQKTRRFLKKNGVLVASIPNVGNWRIRIKLLLGKFDFQEQGILDRTHLHFFTLKMAKALIERNGFVIEGMEFVPSVPIPNPLHIGFVDKLKEIFAGILPGLFSFQFLIVAKKA